MEIGIFLMPAHPPERSLYDATDTLPVLIIQYVAIALALGVSYGP